MKRLPPALPLAIALALLILPGCGKEQPAPEADASGGPQIATSIDDIDLPVDRSAQITTIDAATGDAGGMPRDGGAVVKIAKEEERSEAAPEEPAAVPAAIPVITPPPPPPAPPAIAAQPATEE